MQDEENAITRANREDKNGLQRRRTYRPSKTNFAPQSPALVRFLDLFRGRCFAKHREFSPLLVELLTTANPSYFQNKLEVRLSAGKNSIGKYLIILISFVKY